MNDIAIAALSALAGALYCLALALRIVLRLTRRPRKRRRDLRARETFDTANRPP